MSVTEERLSEAELEAQGLLHEVADQRARMARIELLRRLAADGAPLDELKKTVDEDRLALVPVERVLARVEETLTPREVAQTAEIDVSFLLSLQHA